MAISVYDPNLWNEKIPANVRGGINRAKLAMRDTLGRFKPYNYHLLYDLEHGKAGGKKRAETGKRDSKGRFVK